MGGNGGILGSQGVVTDSTAITGTRVAQAGPITNTSKPTKKPPTRATAANERKNLLGKAKRCLLKIDRSMSTVEIFDWKEERVSKYLKKVGYWAWTNSPTEIFLNIDVAAIQLVGDTKVTNILKLPRPEQEILLFAILYHESLHIKWFTNNGHPKTFLAGAKHEKDTYGKSSGWLWEPSTPQLKRFRKRPDLATLIHEMYVFQAEAADDLGELLSKIKDLSAEKQEAAAFKWMAKDGGFPPNLSKVSSEAIEQLYGDRL